MLYKCNYCDPIFTKEMRDKGLKPIKTVDTETNDFIKDDNSKYYHQSCFKKHLKENKKMDEDKIESEFQRLLHSTLIDVKEANDKDIFLKWIMEFYDGSLPSYYLKKLQSVRDGSYDGIPEPIDYETLLDIYTYMAAYLRKRTLQLHIDKVTQRMNYDLAVVVGNYGDYKRFKEKQRLNQSDSKKVDNETKVTDKVNEINKNDKHNDEFDITDIIDDLML